MLVLVVDHSYLFRVLQFLPYNKLLELVEMTPAQLLKETETAVGDPELWKQHVSLIKKNAGLKAIQNVSASQTPDHISLEQYLLKSTMDSRKEGFRVQDVEEFVMFFKPSNV